MAPHLSFTSMPVLISEAVTSHMQVQPVIWLPSPLTSFTSRFPCPLHVIHWHNSEASTSKHHTLTPRTWLPPAVPCLQRLPSHQPYSFPLVINLQLSHVLSSILRGHNPTVIPPLQTFFILLCEPGKINPPTCPPAPGGTSS